MAAAMMMKKMAAAKKRVDQVAWQIEVATDEEWDDLMKNTGLIVVDVYSDWCGSCTAMASHLKEIKLQLGDDLLHCALAKSDNITQLEKFRCHSEPTFVFIAGGEPVALIRGANAPLIRKTLITELENEKGVLNGKRQRIALDWAAFEFSVDEPEEEEEPSGTEEHEESTAVPLNWSELDALVLEGPGQPVVDRFTRLLNEERPQVTVEAKTTGQIEERACFILWLRLPSNRPVEEEVDNEAEKPSDEDFVTWIESTVRSIIAQLSAEEEVTQQQESNGPVDSQVDDGAAVREEEPPQGDEPEESLDAAVVADKETIQFRFLTHPADKEELIQQLEQSTTNEQEPEQESPSAEQVASSVTPANNEPEAPLAVD